MGPFLRKNVAFGVASTAALIVGKKLWDLNPWVSSLGAALPEAAVTGLLVLLGAISFLVGAYLFVWLYMAINRWLGDM
jgi:hypothetical protein